MGTISDPVWVPLGGPGSHETLYITFGESLRKAHTPETFRVQKKLGTPVRETIDFPKGFKGFGAIRGSRRAPLGTILDPVWVPWAAPDCTKRYIYI